MSDVPEALGESANFHAWLKGLELYQGQVAAFSYLPPREFGETPVYEGAYAGLAARLGLSLYRHQVEALLALEAGQHVVVATPTASGKSLVYQLPTLAALERGQTALYLFPTKALAHDQLTNLQSLAAACELEALIASYDGDTPAGKRAAVREGAACILTNPDMLHYGMLAYHAKWARFLGRLEHIVVDELHSYRGVMGSHVANILRRLLRMARHYGASPSLITASATIGNPAEHAQNLTGQAFVAIREDAGPRAARELIFWEPPLLSEEGDGRRRSANTEAALLAAQFVRAGLKSIFFCNSRKTAELLRRYASTQLSPEEANYLESYRAGYTPEDRRSIETRFRRGELRVLCATSALELGVDIGGVDAVVLVGYPGSLTALWQRAGRAGRRGKRALTLLIPGNDPLDEYYLHHPDLILDGRVEDAVADPFNSEIHPLHIACAAAEKPLAKDAPILAPWLSLKEHPNFAERQDHWVYLGRYPHRQLSVRGTGGKQITLKDGFGKTVGISDYATALRDLHPGAVYLHQGETYLVCELNLNKGEATLLPHIEDYYTQTRSETDIEVLEHAFSHLGVQVGRVRVTTRYLSYVKKRYFSEAILDERLLDLPDLSYATQALWFSVAEQARALPKADFPSAMHALEHTLIGLLPAFILCERADVGGVSYPMYPATGEPLIFIYDGYPGGVGYARAGASVFVPWLEAARDLLRDCPCKTGCPRCVLSPKCGNGNQYLDKDAALCLAKTLLKGLETKESRMIN